MPVGPLTNVALALDRGLRPERIVLMGGAIAEGNMTPAAEFNIWADPEAAQRVFHAGVPVTMIGLDVTHQALLTPAWAERFRAAGRVGTFVAELVEFFKRYHARTYGWDGAPIHDALALAQVIQPGLVATEHVNVEVELESELCRGRTVVDLWQRTDAGPERRRRRRGRRRRIPRAPARADRYDSADAAGTRPRARRRPRSRGRSLAERHGASAERRPARARVRARRRCAPRLERAAGHARSPGEHGDQGHRPTRTPSEARSPTASARNPIAGGPTRKAE